MEINHNYAIIGIFGFLIIFALGINQLTVGKYPYKIEERDQIIINDKVEEKVKGVTDIDQNIDYQEKILIDLGEEILCTKLDSESYIDLYKLIYKCDAVGVYVIDMKSEEGILSSVTVLVTDLNGDVISVDENVNLKIL